MSAGAEHIYMTFIDIDRYLTKRLYGVRVKQNSFFMSDRADLFYRLYRTDLIVRKHDRDQYRIRSDRRLYRLRIYNSIFIHIEISNLIPSLLKIFTCMQNGMMFNLRRNNMLSFCAIRLCCRRQCPVVGFRSRRKINLIFLCSDHTCDRLSLF